MHATTVSILRSVGLLITASSFAMPAVGDGRDTLSGWACAFLALNAWTQIDNAQIFVIGVIGLINPILLAILLLVLFHHSSAIWLRRALASIILMLIPVAIFEMQHAKMPVRIGCVVWMPGVILTSGVEFIRSGKRSPTTPVSA